MSNTIQDIEQKRALLVGINHYYLDDDSIGNLQYCVNDVVELDEILSDRLRGDFITQSLHSELSNRKLSPTRSNIMSMLKLLSSNSEKKDSILFYFAGHGFEKDGVNYLLPADARLNVLSETAIPIKWVKKTLSQSLASKIFIIIDACHAGSRLGRSEALSMTKSFHDEIFSEAEGFAIMSSCKIDQLSYDYDKQKHGVFSYYLLEGLRGCADENSDHIVTVPESYSYVVKKVRNWSLEKCLEQSPTFNYDVSGDFIFVKVPTEAIVDMSSKFVVSQKIEIMKKSVQDSVESISFMSDKDLRLHENDFDYLDFTIFCESDKTFELSKFFLNKIRTTRFSCHDAQRRLRSLVLVITGLNEIKKWIKNNPEIKQYLILEFISSDSFDYAGTTAEIICNILPSLTDDELLILIKAMRENNQIISSFKARSYVKSILDACKHILPLENYIELKEKYGLY